MNRSNVGKVWLTEEIRRLKTEFDGGMTLEQICDAHGRTPYGVVSMLKQLNLITQVGDDYHKIDQEPWELGSEVRRLHGGSTG